jgi:hypothetical protein
VETLKAMLDHQPLAPLFLLITIGYLIAEAKRERSSRG